MSQSEQTHQKTWTRPLRRASAPAVGRPVVRRTSNTRPRSLPSLLASIQLLAVALFTLGPTSVAFADITVYQSGSRWAVIESDGDIYIEGSRVGQIEPDGDVYKHGSRIGEIESDGDIYHHGSRIGQIESDGDIYQRGSRWGDAQPCCGSFEEMRQLVAVLFFFDSGFLL